MTTWRKMLIETRDELADVTPIEAYAPDEAAFDVEFDDGYGLASGPQVLAWSSDYVFFPVVYDGAEWLGSAPRNPRLEGQAHEGGQ